MGGFYRSIKNLIPRPIRSKLYHWFDMLRTRAIAVYTILRPNSRELSLLHNGTTFIADGFATSHFVGFLEDTHFAKSFGSACDGVPKLVVGPPPSIEWRAHICTWAAQQALSLEGDFVECGVWYGVLSKTVCEYVNFGSTGRNFYLIDSWGAQEGSHPNPNYQEDIFDLVKNRFSMYPNVHLVRGLVPKVLEQVPTTKVAYLAIDMNGSVAELAALEFFYEKMVSGGVIYLDDYGWGYPDLRRVVNNFLADKPESLLHFPSGNSIIVKT